MGSSQRLMLQFEFCCFFPHSVNCVLCLSNVLFIFFFLLKPQFQSWLKAVNQFVLFPSSELDTLEALLHFSPVRMCPVPLLCRGCPGSCWGILECE